MQALSAYLAEQLAPLGVTGSEAIVARSNAEMVALLRSGAVDVVSETVMSAFLYADEAGAHPLMREWKRGRVVLSLGPVHASRRRHRVD